MRCGGVRLQNHFSATSRPRGTMPVARRADERVPERRIADVVYSAASVCHE